MVITRHYVLPKYALIQHDSVHFMRVTILLKHKFQEAKDMAFCGSCFCALICLQVFGAVFTGAEQNSTISSCVPAEKTVNASLVSKTCRPYKYQDDGYCRHILGNVSVYGSDNDQYRGEQSFALAFKGKKLIEKYQKIQLRKFCFGLWLEKACKGNFPKCDKTTARLVSRPVCRETCENVEKLCQPEMQMLKRYNDNRAPSTENEFPLYWSITNCSSLPRRNAGEVPECYFSRGINSETDKLKGQECYYGNGLGYRGNVSVTRLGQVCQSWSSQCPHRHDHPLSEYPELVNASNWCRNPGGQGPDGPWCYTTNSSIRWEYCDVEKCPPPAPTLVPVIKQAYATGSSSIYITWEPVPLPFFHGQPGGYRIKISELGQEPIINETTSPNVTDFEYRNLQALRNYSLSVLAFNDAGDGPSSEVYIKTMPENFVTVRYALAPLNTTTGKYRTLFNKVKEMILKSFEKKYPDGYNIFQIKIPKIKTRQMKFDIIAELTGRPSWSAVQDITGRILQGFRETTTLAKKFQPSSLLVQAPSPPPTKVTNSDIDMTSVTVDWSVPLYHGPYRITNYTVQYKKAGTDMKYYDAVTVGSHKTKVTVKNLVSAQKYLIRVTSANDYGSEASQPMEVTTISASEEFIKTVLPIILPLFILMFITGAGLVIWWYKKRKESREIQDMIKKITENPTKSVVDWFAVLKIKITKQWWEIPRDDLLLDRELGSGAFGVVMKGYLTKREEGENENRILCAVKMLKDNPTEQELRDLCNEINVMSSVGDHPNLVSLIGACTINGPPWLVVKFAPNGCLHDYLKDNRPPPKYQNTREEVTKSQLMLKPISEKERMRFAYEIAQGMAHLERHRFAHRDLAARNILLGKNMVAMVSDFGLSRDIYQTGAYEKTGRGVLPVRWMALESLQDYTYSSKSDVWSFGVVLWEIESGGLMPYAGMSGAEVVERLRQGYRLERPQNASRDIYGIMWHCWNPDPNQRPTFANLVYKIGGLINHSKDHRTMELVSNSNAYC